MSGKSNETPIQYLQKVEGHGNKINSQLGNPKRPFKTLWEFKSLLSMLKVFNTLLILNFSNAGQQPAEGWFLSKWEYKFCPSKKLLHLSGYFKHPIGGGQLPKNRCEIL